MNIVNMGLNASQNTCVATRDIHKYAGSRVRVNRKKCDEDFSDFAGKVGSGA